MIISDSEASGCSETLHMLSTALYLKRKLMVILFKIDFILVICWTQLIYYNAGTIYSHKYYNLCDQRILHM